ncbi:MAG: choice-of-anchor J domain-containing protein [Bacteroidales bacterium]|nr:choice-of-anchor J domain-containing protein [Bacteroidales bacterium]
MGKFYKKLLIVSLFINSSIGILYGQINTGILPDSFNDKLAEDHIDHIYVNPPSMELIIAEDTQDEKNGTMYKIARLIPVELNISNSGTWDKTSDGKDIWRLKISSDGAKSCAIHFDEFSLPAGSQLFIYNFDRSVILGPYTNLDNEDGGSYAIGILYGNEIIIEYTAPKSKSLNNDIEIVLPNLEISKYSYIYRGEDLYDYRNLKSTGYGASDDCQVNVNCSEGNNWRTQQKGVARIYVVDGWSAGYCTGSLVNNTNNDQTPYFLTADHCGGEVSTSDFGQWIFRFNYESPGCTAITQPTGNNVTGCTKKARAPLDGGSDFLLLQLNTTSTNLKSIGAVYNGWRNNLSASSSGVSIHHPSGDIKKISTYTSALSSSTYNGQDETGATNAHWRVYWAETDNGHGVTEGGSSGSPIFDNNGLIIGTLSGGSSTCDNTNYPDLYGKFSYHWISNGSTNADRLQPWLDPDNTSTSCDYLDPNNVGLVADFSGSPTSVTVGNSVTFTDLSSGGTITSRSWTFQGGTPSTSTAASPTITYNTAGTYNVSLTVYTSTENASVTKNAYITVTDPGSGFTYDFEACTDFAVDQFSPCTTYDGDGSASYASADYDFNNEGYTGSFIAFNPSTTTPAAGTTWAAHGGTKYGACFSATTPANNDWFITPQISLLSNSSFSFWAKTLTDEWGKERFNVYISNTNNSIGSFTKISSGTYLEAPTTWTQYTYDLSSYNNQDVYLAIQCVSNDAFVFMIDDIVVFTEQGVIAPVANFTGAPTSGCASLTVNLTDASNNNPTSWLWTCPGGTPSSSTQQNPTIVYNTPGTYSITLKATNAGGNNSVTRNSYITVTDCSAVDDNLSSKISIYPNPTDGMLNIDIPETKATVRINNVLGKEVKLIKLNSDRNTIDLSSLSSGMYFIEIQLSEQKIVSKITIR